MKLMIVTLLVALASLLVSPEPATCESYGCSGTWCADSSTCLPQCYCINHHCVSANDTE